MSADAVPRRFLVDLSKLTHYLLDLDHPAGASKARFFIGHGFHPSLPDTLGAALVGHPEAAVNSYEVDRTGRSRFVYEGPIASPDGRNPNVRTVWQPNAAGEAYFLTAYPWRPGRQVAEGA